MTDKQKNQTSKSQMLLYILGIQWTTEWRSKQMLIMYVYNTFFKKQKMAKKGIN